MTFSDVADLAADPEYQRRLAACVYSETLAKPSDFFTDQILRTGPGFAAQAFGPTIASSPGFGGLYAEGGQERITDGDLLAAVQFNWSRIAALYTPPAMG